MPVDDDGTFNHNLAFAVSSEGALDFVEELRVPESDWEVADLTASFGYDATLRSRDLIQQLTAAAMIVQMVSGMGQMPNALVPGSNETTLWQTERLRVFANDVVLRFMLGLV